MSDRGMKQLSDSLLIQSYHKAIELNLSSEFVNQIKEELQKRSLLKGVEKHTSQVS